MFKLVLKTQRNRDQIANICWIIEKAREFQKTSISALFFYFILFFLFFILFYLFIFICSEFALLTMPKPLTMWIMINCGKF